MSELQRLRHLQDVAYSDLAWLTMQISRLREDIACVQASQAAELTAHQLRTDLARLRAERAAALSRFQFYTRRIKTVLH